MAGERPKPLTSNEAKNALLEWGRGVDRAMGSIVRRHRYGLLGTAVALGVAIAWFGPLRPRGGSRRRSR